MIDGRDKMEADIAVELSLLDRLTTQEIENVSELSQRLGIAQDRQHRFKKRTEALWRLQEGLDAFKRALNGIGEK